MIRVSVDRYQGDGSADFWTSGDPFFVVHLDVNNDGVNDLTYTSEVFQDEELLSSPYSVTIDIPDGTSAIKFTITVYDSDIEGNEVIDYSPEAGYTGYIHTVSSPYNDSWSYNGSDDGLGETDCILDYSISVTA
jgi:hypothetical protein